MRLSYCNYVAVLCPYSQIYDDVFILKYYNCHFIQRVKKTKKGMYVFIDMTTDEANVSGY